MVKVLFVCLGNICRSPTAEGVFRDLVVEQQLTEEIEVDSAGTHDYHTGAPPDARAQETALRRGIDLSDLRGRQATVHDMAEFDYVLAMDNENYANLLRIAKGREDRVHLFLQFTQDFEETEVPDPYFGGDAGFDRVLDMIESASMGLLKEIRANHGI